jgi:hypothetical protein
MIPPGGFLPASLIHGLVDPDCGGPAQRETAAGAADRVQLDQ